MLLVGRHGIKGGETRVFDVDSPGGQRFTLSEPWSLLLLDDQRVIHETTPIQPMDGEGWRDTLVVTFIALLELAKETLIEITQAEAFAPIYVRLAYTPN